MFKGAGEFVTKWVRNAIDTPVSYTHLISHNELHEDLNATFKQLIFTDKL